MRSLLGIKKIIAIVHIGFDHEFNSKHLSNRFDVGTSTLHKYVNVVCNVLCNKNKFFGKISPSFEDHLLHLLQQFQELTGLLNICGIIDGTHISLVEMPNKRYILVLSNYYN